MFIYLVAIHIINTKYLTWTTGLVICKCTLLHYPSCRREDVETAILIEWTLLAVPSRPTGGKFNGYK